jgi:DNA-binding beta-propeller fold protein YncE
MKLRSSAIGFIAACLAIVVIPQQVFARQPIPLNQPNGLIFDNDGNLYVANAGSNQILVYDAKLVQRASISAGLDFPVRLAFDPFGDLYVANFKNDSITVYDANLRQIVGKTIAQHLHSPLGVAVDAYGDVFAANNGSNTIAVFNVDGNYIWGLHQDANGRQFYAPGALAIGGTELFVGTGPTSGHDYVTAYNVGEFLMLRPRQFTTISNQMSGPTGIAFDRRGNVYVSDFYSSTAIKYDPAGQVLLTITNGIAQPEGIAVDAHGNIYVSSQFANTITVYDSSGNLIHTIH